MRLIAQKASEVWPAGDSIDESNRCRRNMVALGEAIADPDGYTLFMARISEPTLLTPRYLTVWAFRPNQGFRNRSPRLLLFHYPFVVPAADAPPIRWRTHRLLPDQEKSGENGTFASQVIGSGGPHHGRDVRAPRSARRLWLVPYRGAGPSINDLLACHVELMFAYHSLAGSLYISSESPPALEDSRREYTGPTPSAECCWRWHWRKAFRERRYAGCAVVRFAGACWNAGVPVIAKLRRRIRRGVALNPDVAQEPCRAVQVFPTMMSWTVRTPLDSG